LTYPLSIALIVVRTGVTVLAGVAPGQLLGFVAEAGRTIAGRDEAVVRFGISAVHELTGDTLSANAVVHNTAHTPVLAVCAILFRGEDTASERIACVLGTGVVIIADQVLSTDADPAFFTAVILSTHVLVIAGGPRVNEGVLTNPCLGAYTDGAIVAVVTILIVAAEHNLDCHHIRRVDIVFSAVIDSAPDKKHHKAWQENQQCICLVSHQ